MRRVGLLAIAYVAGAAGYAPTAGGAAGMGDCSRHVHASLRTVVPADGLCSADAQCTPARLQPLRAVGTAILASSLVFLSCSVPALAENELASLAGDRFHSELVRPECFAENCKLQTQACADEPDCMKGLACTAKCMGDAECAVGCFAQYGNKVLDNMLQCTIEDEGCIKIAIMEPGADSPSEAPQPPRPLIAATPASMQGRWYKVMGWNSKYDCFECQRNSFSKPAASVVSADIGIKSMDVEVEYQMPRERQGQAPSYFRQTLHENLVFDEQPGSRRTAHTEGKMFGLTFWENWYVIGENSKQEPQFKFVYYTGKTLQNRYEGAFVYARKPELPAASMPHIYRLAREAGMEPTDFCAIDNRCYSAPTGVAQPPPFTQVAAADAEITASDRQALQQPSIHPIQRLVRDVSELLEDPRPFGRAITQRQRHMFEIREYDPNGYRLASDEYNNER